MIANYGYEDGTGLFYISVETNKCAECSSKACVSTCESGVYVIEEDDWGDEIIAVDGGKALALRDVCIVCKKGDGDEPCVASCSSGALTFSW